MQFNNTVYTQCDMLLFLSEYVNLTLVGMILQCDWIEPGELKNFYIQLKIMSDLIKVEYTSTKRWTVNNDIEMLVNGYIREHESASSLNITIMLLKIILQFTKTDWIMKYEDGTQVCNYWWKCISNSASKFEWKPICRISNGSIVSFGKRIETIEPFYTKWFVTVQSRILMNRIIFFMKAQNGDNIFHIKINNQDHCRYIIVGNKFFGIETPTIHIKQKDMIRFDLDLQDNHLQLNMIIISDDIQENNIFELPKKNGGSLLFGFEYGQYLNIVNYGYVR
eukprot:555786_1